MEPVTLQRSEDAYPLSERMPDFVVTFAIGFVGAAAVGLVVGGVVHSAFGLLFVVVWS